jgi:2-polyprenyl-3-methyl-5-hydroxy-6-metoxy-1,4-benzoquinol methylase
LDVGCGPGLSTNIFTINGFNVKALDISSGMVAVAKKNAPLAKIEQGDFLLYSSKKKFHGIFMQAFIHLFSKKDCQLVLDKINELLEDNGVCLISTTISPVSKEGFFIKKEYLKVEKRFRKFWRKRELEDFLKKEFDMIKVFENKDPLHLNKVWFNVIVKKK